MRVFAAIALSDDARRWIGRAQERLKSALDRRSLRWVRPEHLHLTLLFLGDVGDAHASALVEAFGRGVDQSGPFRMVCAGLGVFPPRGRPRTLWLGVTAGAREVAEVRRAIVGLLSGVGLGSREESFHPHVTLARWREAGPADRERILAADTGAAVAAVAVDAVVLYRSQLSSAGPIHTELARARLTA
jgi:2'-5' RNA ligase